MGMVYDTDEVKAGEWWVETRAKSVVISTSNEVLEINYEQLDSLQKAVEFAQKVRRDKNKKGGGKDGNRDTNNSKT